MSTVTSFDRIYTDILTAQIKLVQSDHELSILFDTTYREELCAFNIQQFLAANCKLSDKRKVHALRQASLRVRTRAEELTSQDSPSVTTISADVWKIRYQIWSPSLVATLDSLTSSPVPTTPTAGNVKRTTKSKPERASNQRASPRVQSKLPADKLPTIVQELQVIQSTQVLYPKLCSEVGCKWCLVFMFKRLPLTKCGDRCQHPAVSCGYFPHAATKLQLSLKDRHGQDVVLKTSTKGYSNPFTDNTTSEQTPGPSTSTDGLPEPPDDLHSSMDDLSLEDPSQTESTLWADEPLDLGKIAANACVPVIRPGSSQLANITTLNSIESSVTKLRSPSKRPSPYKVSHTMVRRSKLKEKVTPHNTTD